MQYAYIAIYVSDVFGNQINTVLGNWFNIHWHDAVGKNSIFMVISNSVSTRISKLTQLFKTLDFLNILLIGVQSQIMT